MPEVGEIVTRVLGDWSLEQAAQKLGYELTRTPIGDLKKGKIGREKTCRVFAEGLWERFCEAYGEEIRARFSDCSPTTVSDWFCHKAGFGIRYSIMAQPAAKATDRGAITYETDLDDVDISSFRGAEGLPPEDITLGNEMMRAFLAAKRRNRGLD